MSQTKVQLIKDGALAEDSIVHDGDTNTKIRFSGTDTITAETGGSERVRVDSSGRVGIGTNNPQTPLDTTGTGVIARFKSTNNNYVVSLLGNNASQQSFIGTTSAGDMTFATGSGVSERVRIESSGATLASKNFVSKKSNDASVATSTASGFTANSFNVVLGQDVLEAESTYLITFKWDHQGSGQPFESYGSFTFQPGSTNPGSTATIVTGKQH